MDYLGRSVIGHILRNISTTNDVAAMPMALFDSACQIGLSMLLYNVLTACRGLASLGYTNIGICHICIYISSIRAAMVKQTSPLDSPGEICVNTFWTGVPTVGGATASVDSKKQRNWTWFLLYLHNQGSYGIMDSVIGFCASDRSRNHLDRRSNCRWRGPWWCYKNCEIGYIFDCAKRSSGAKAKRIAPLNSVWQIGPKTTWTDVLIVDEVIQGWFLKLHNRVHFWLHRGNQWRYRETDGTIWSSVSNMYIYSLEGGSDSKSRCLKMEI